MTTDNRESLLRQTEKTNVFKNPMGGTAGLHEKECAGKRNGIGCAVMSSEWSTLPRTTADFPFRLGVTSYVYPADILPNVEKVAPVVDDVELVLFETGKLPSLEAVERLAELRAQHDLTYTVHLPIDKQLGSANPAERAAMTAGILNILRLTAPLAPHAYIVHLGGITATAAAAEVRRWQQDVAVALEKILAAGTASSLFCVETLDYPMAWCDPLLDTFGLSVCLDVGHLWRYRFSVADHLGRYLPRTRVVHLHGEQDGRDHLSLEVVDEARMNTIGQALVNFSGVVTLELFGYDVAAASIRRLAAWWQKNAASQCL